MDSSELNNLLTVHSLALLGTLSKTSEEFELLKAKYSNNLISENQRLENDQESAGEIGIW